MSRILEEELPWWSSGQDSILPVPGARFHLWSGNWISHTATKNSYVETRDPRCHNKDQRSCMLCLRPSTGNNFFFLRILVLISAARILNLEWYRGDWHGTCTRKTHKFVKCSIFLWKLPRCPSTDAWIKNLWYTHTMECYSAIKRSTFESVLMRWMNLEPIIQSEVSPKKKDKYRILMHVYRI